MRDAKITLDFGDGTYVFRLGYDELMALQEKLDAGPGWILERMLNPTPENRGWRVQDIAQILRLGLIGGKMEPIKALGLVRTYVEQRPPMENIHRAIAVLSAALVGAPDEAQSKKKTVKRQSRAASGASGTSGPSSEPESQSA